MLLKHNRVFLFRRCLIPIIFCIISKQFPKSVNDVTYFQNNVTINLKMWLTFASLIIVHKTYKMKTTQSNFFKTNMLVGLLVTMMLFLFGSCSQKISFLTSSVVPAARGDATIKRDKNKNYVIALDISDLAEVNRLQPAKETYVVWIETDSQIMRNVGQIKSSTSLLSKKLRASFETVSSYQPYKIFITAENNPSAPYPGEQIVLSTDHEQNYSSFLIIIFSIKNKKSWVIYFIQSQSF
jgi:hypothetical protein